MNFLQKDLFIKQEADDWFRRNIRMIEEYDGRQDPVCRLINRYNLKPARILEIGSSAGHRLAYLRSVYPEAEIYGIEPSPEAISFGNKRYDFGKNVLSEGTADNLSTYQNENFDLVIMGFIFYVIDRELLLKVIAEADRVLGNNGQLLITDFFAAKTQRNEYHHWKGMNIFSYKQNYENIFLSTGIYHLIAKDTLNHTDRSYCSNDDFYNKYAITLLKKHLSVSYE